MTEQEVSKADLAFTVPIFNTKHRNLDASDIRRHFIISGAKSPSKIAALDAASQVYVREKYSPLLSEITILYGPHEYPSIKQAWETFQDIGDCKFSRVGKKGEFPTKESFDGKTGEVETDTWEVDKIRVFLVVRGTFSEDGKNSGFEVILKATDLTAQTTK